MEGIVWKVVWRVWFSSEYESIIARGRNCLSYKIGEITTPTVGKIFAFDSLESAQDFIYGTRHAHILRCECEVAETSPAWVPDVDINDADIKYYWELNDSGQLEHYVSPLGPPPDGTVLCNWVRPIEVVG